MSFVKNKYFFTVVLISVLVLSCKKEKASSDDEGLAAGQFYGGGIIFYVDGSGEHGLVVSESNQSNSLRWFNGSYLLVNAVENTVGKGQINTDSIIAVQGTGEYAASACANLSLNGYNDWFLPSRNELNLLFQQRNQIGGFTEGYYWSSTEYDTTHAWNQYFPYGPQYYADKSDSACVRAIRAF